MDKMSAKQVTFGGMVFMYGNMQIIADKSSDKIVLTKLAGADGFSGESEEKDEEAIVFDKLIDAIDAIECSMSESAEENTFIADEEEEETGAYEWYVAVCDEEENLLFCLRGINPESEAFKSISEALENACTDFGCINAFFKGVNE